MPEFFQQFINDPYLLSGLIFLTTFVLEDLATAIAGAAAVEHMIPFGKVYIALFSGIFLGDLGLYGLGNAARKFQFAKRILAKKHVRLSKNWIGKRYIATIIGARFVPGLRLPTYAAFGFFKLPFKVFFLTSLFSVGIWTALVLGSIFLFDITVGEKIGMWKWPGIAALILVFILGPKIYILRSSPWLNKADSSNKDKNNTHIDK